MEEEYEEDKITYKRGKTDEKFLRLSPISYYSTQLMLRGRTFVEEVLNNL